MKLVSITLVTFAIATICTIIWTYFFVHATLNAEERLRAQITKKALADQQYKIRLMGLIRSQDPQNDPEKLAAALKAIQEAVSELKEDEKKLVRNGLEQPSVMGRVNYAIKVISKEDPSVVGH